MSKNRRSRVNTSTTSLAFPSAHEVALQTSYSQYLFRTKPSFANSTLVSQPNLIENVALRSADVLDDISGGTNWQSVGQSAVSIERQSTSDGYEVLLLGFQGSYLALARKKPSEECTLCKTTRVVVNGLAQERKDICSSLELLLQKAGGGTLSQSVIENKLCPAALSNTNLAAIAGQLSGYLASQIRASLSNDVNSSSCSSTDLCGNIAKLNPSILTTWNYLYDKTKSNARKNWNTLSRFGYLSSSVQEYLVRFGDTPGGA